MQRLCDKYNRAIDSIHQLGSPLEPSGIGTCIVGAYGLWVSGGAAETGLYTCGLGQLPTVAMCHRRAVCGLCAESGSRGCDVHTRLCTPGQSPRAPAEAGSLSSLGFVNVAFPLDLPASPMLPAFLRLDAAWAAPWGFLVLPRLFPHKGRETQPAGV
ncbi:hypothetical protein P7K49_032847 [Saguinus oedipus]|uniref:Uncharacterized protein n=1 Tax=Saguinus oedipus TaxID=9490 RepID=A0ABQ9TQX9_SAGOE|nr:hypothetical protein P7K49_032847 [Saguinus oedipus]